MKAIIAVMPNEEQLNENVRHSKAMESIAKGKKLYLTPHKNRMGLYISPKNFN